MRKALLALSFAAFLINAQALKASQAEAERDDNRAAKGGQVAQTTVKKVGKSKKSRPPKEARKAAAAEKKAKSAPGAGQ